MRPAGKFPAAGQRSRAFALRRDGWRPLAPACSASSQLVLGALLRAPFPCAGVLTCPPLTAPRFEGSIGLSHRATAPCLWQEDFKGVVVEQQGFEFRPERPNASEFRNQKWGWTSSRPGEEGGPCAGVTRHAHGGARSSPRRRGLERA